MKGRFEDWRVRALLACALALSTACSNDLGYEIAQQKWRDVIVRIESRPAPPEPGMNEFWVILNDVRGRPVHNAIVSIRGSSSVWHQAIQDGHTGVFRRSARIDDPATMPLVVKLQMGKELGELSFDLSPATSDRTNSESASDDSGRHQN